jgi:hypothetical protein
MGKKKKKIKNRETEKEKTHLDILKPIHYMYNFLILLEQDKKKNT